MQHAGGHKYHEIQCGNANGDCDHQRLGGMVVTPAIGKTIHAASALVVAMPEDSTGRTLRRSFP